MRLQNPRVRTNLWLFLQDQERASKFGSILGRDRGLVNNSKSLFGTRHCCYTCKYLIDNLESGIREGWDMCILHGSNLSIAFQELMCTVIINQSCSGPTIKFLILHPKTYSELICHFEWQHYIKNVWGICFFAMIQRAPNQHRGVVDTGFRTINAILQCTIKILWLQNLSD